MKILLTILAIGRNLFIFKQQFVGLMSEIDAIKQEGFYFKRILCFYYKFKYLATVINRIFRDSYLNPNI